MLRPVRWVFALHTGAPLSSPHTAILSSPSVLARLSADSYQTTIKVLPFEICFVVGIAVNPLPAFLSAFLMLGTCPFRPLHQ